MMAFKNEQQQQNSTRQEKEGKQMTNETIYGVTSGAEAYELAAWLLAEYTKFDFEDWKSVLSQSIQAGLEARDAVFISDGHCRDCANAAGIEAADEHLSKWLRVSEQGLQVKEVDTSDYEEGNEEEEEDQDF